MKASKHSRKSEATTQPSKTGATLTVAAVPIDLIDPSPLNRSVEDADELVPLSANVSETATPTEFSVEGRAWTSP